MWYLIAAIGLRFALAGMIYLCAVTVWISNIQGWATLETLGRSIGFGFIAAAALMLSVIACRHISGPLHRPIVHVLLTVFLFTTLGYVIAGWLMGMHNHIGADILPFIWLVTAVAIVDALAGYWLDGWVARRAAGAH